jgi:hypothetical protein
MRNLTLVAVGLGLVGACTVEEASSSSGGGGATSSTSTSSVTSTSTSTSTSSSAGGGGGAGGGVAMLVDCSDPKNFNLDVCTVPEPDPGAIGKGPGVQNDTFGSFGRGFIEGNLLYVTVFEPFANKEAAFLISVNLDTGDRTLLSGLWDDPKNGETTLGTGPLGGDNGDVIRGKDGALHIWSNKLQLLRVDPMTGDRTLEYDQKTSPCVTTMGKLIGADTSAGIEVDEQGRIYSSGSSFTDYFILRYVGSPLTCEIASASGDGNGVDFLEWTGITYRQNKLYGLWYTSESLLEYDATTNKRTRVSSSSQSTHVGSGPPFGTTSAYAADSNTVWVAGGTLGVTDTITKVDVAKGDRKAFVAKAGPLQSTYYPLVYGEYKGMLVMSNFGSITLFDTATGNSNRISR